MAVRDVVQAAAGVGGGGEYVEDVFSTYLYTGNSSTQAINNGIDLDGEGGLVWTKARGVNAESALIDTERGQGNYIPSNATSASAYYSDLVTGFTSTGYTLGADVSRYIVNKDAYTYASWTFRKAPKFFDVVTYTGDGGNMTIPHNLGVTPGMIIVKRTDTASYWRVHHRSVDIGKQLYLNETYAQDSGSQAWNNTLPTDTAFTVGLQNTDIGGTFVAYLFAHDAGGFGDDGEQNIISCGSFTTDGSGNATVNLGWEPQWVLFKASSRVLNWSIHDTMRGMPVGSVAAGLYPNLANAESNNVNSGPTATGFTWSGYANETFVYVAIRRPMKTPESGTEVYNALAANGTSSARSITGIGFSPDFFMHSNRDKTYWGQAYTVASKLQGKSKYLNTQTTSGEGDFTPFFTSFDNDGISLTSSGFNASGGTYITNFFRRAPGFMDVVCYSGTGSATAQTHNLGVVPELVIVRARNNTNNWQVYNAIDGAGSLLLLNTTQAAQGGTPVSSLTSTSLTFAYNANYLFDCSGIGVTYVAYLFASLPGVSKVGSYTGTGADLNVDCGFSAGARFILIKRTDAGGDWYVWDSVRGIVAGNDPYLLLNSTAAEVTSTDYIDPLSSGFTVTSSAPAALNASGGSYIFLAIA